MKAAVRTTYGPPEVVRVTNVPTPEPRPSEVLVHVQATTVNRTDRGYRAGKPFIIRFFSGLIRPKVQVLGTEFAGTVEAVASNREREGPDPFDRRAVRRPVKGASSPPVAADVPTAHNAVSA